MEDRHGGRPRQAGPRPAACEPAEIMMRSAIRSLRHEGPLPMFAFGRHAPNAGLMPPPWRKSHHPKVNCSREETPE